MRFNTDYFLLYHGINFETAELSKIKKTQDAFFFEIAALLLCTTRKELTKFNALDSFKKFALEITEKPCNTIDDLYLLQATIIDYIDKHLCEDNLQSLHLAFDYLFDENVLSHENHEKLLSIFDPHIFRVYEDEPVYIESETNDFIERKNELGLIINDLSKLGKNSSFRDDLRSVELYLQSQRFSIGITGVMNAGKSTLLNALLGEEILGTSVVPETANLSLLKYSKKPYANVSYWSKYEWKKIVDCGHELESMALFVKQTEERFKDDLFEYIKEDARVDEIKVKDLYLYTSANASEGRCNLIKQVELGVNLEFLAGGIEIVDTPGLDDIVIQREEITREYLSQCDLMIHLMNVSQSATQKDVEFIIDTLRYQNVSKLLIVLTRADTLKESELQEVIAYTKQSIKAQLESINELPHLDRLLSSLHFISVSSKMALYHRTNQAQLALDHGYTLEKSGIIELEKYLFETLYGDGSEKSDLIIRSAKSRLYRSIKTEIKSLRYELYLLSQSKDELETESEKTSVKKQENIKLLSALKEELAVYKSEIEKYSLGLEVFLDTQMLRVKQRLQARLMDDFVYALEKRGKKEFMDTVGRVLEGAIKDGLIDVIREYRYKFIQKSEEIGNKIDKKYEEYILEFDKKPDEFSTLDLMNEYFKGSVIYSNSTLLSARLEMIFDKTGSKDLSLLEEKVESELQQAFMLLQEMLKQKATKISENLIQEIFSNIYQPLDKLELRVSNEEVLLEQRLKNFEDDDTKRASASIKLHKQIKSLQSSSLRCRS